VNSEAAPPNALNVWLRSAKVKVKAAMATTRKKIIGVLEGQNFSSPPIWLMRQAGRHLPEYRDVRVKVGSFLDLCYTPELAAEVTLQPIRRYNLDAAIIFSDILVIADALGCQVRFSENRGPELNPVESKTINTLDEKMVGAQIMPVLDAIRLVKANLAEDTALIGFCGAPWTVATYMIAGCGTSDHRPARIFAYRYPREFERLLAVLADISAEYLIDQYDAGAEVLQIFDSWADVLGEDEFARFSVAPIARMVAAIKGRRPGAKIIAFARGAGIKLRDFRARTKVDCVGADWTLPLEFVAELQKEGPVQGNLDPVRLLVGGLPLEDAVNRILDKLGHGPLIFNLGHGICPDTPTENVEDLIRSVRRSGAI
jgi:uroporphyrinogen decarboxylase